MSSAPQELGRRERSKREKLQRITSAAGELFAIHGVDEVTTQQIAEKADIGAGTLFLYAKTKGELLLLVQNAHYEDALARGITSAAAQTELVDAVVALVTPIVKCNRVHVENGRTYLREMLFGDATEPHHAEALRINSGTHAALASILQKQGSIDDLTAQTVAGVISSIMFTTMVSAASEGASTTTVILRIRAQLEAVLPR